MSRLEGEVVGMRSSGRRARKGDSLRFLDFFVVVLTVAASAWLFFGGGESVLAAPWWAQLLVALALVGGAVWAVWRLRVRSSDQLAPGDVQGRSEDEN